MQVDLARHKHKVIEFMDPLHLLDRDAALAEDLPNHFIDLPLFGVVLLLDFMGEFLGVRLLGGFLISIFSRGTHFVFGGLTLLLDQLDGRQFLFELIIGFFRRSGPP